MQRSALEGARPRGWCGAGAEELGAALGPVSREDGKEG